MATTRGQATLQKLIHEDELQTEPVAFSRLQRNYTLDEKQQHGTHYLARMLPSFRSIFTQCETHTLICSLFRFSLAA